MEKAEIKAEIRKALQRDGPLTKYLENHKLLGKYIKDFTESVMHEQLDTESSDENIINHIHYRINNYWPMDFPKISRQKREFWREYNISKATIKQVSK